MKKFAVLFLIVINIFVACSSNNNSTSADTNQYSDISIIDTTELKDNQLPDTYSDINDVAEIEDFGDAGSDVTDVAEDAIEKPDVEYICKTHDSDAGYNDVLTVYFTEKSDQMNLKDKVLGIRLMSADLN